MKEFDCMEEKPFSCDIVGCGLKFTNEDHLAVHKNRHGINLNISSKTLNFSDQTPTPTRFIRNCEEVGLFQDLQNVNPFEETFRKAVEAVDHGELPLLGKDLNGVISDDTLHTPNVFPLIHEPPQTVQAKMVEVVSNVIENTESKESIAPKGTRKYRKKIISEGNSPCEPHYFLVDRNITFKLPIPRIPPSVKVFSPKYFSVLSRHSRIYNEKVKNKKDTGLRKVASSSSNDILEKNRLAQIRTREKRKHYLAYLEQLNMELTEKNLLLEKKVAEISSDNSILKCKLERCHRSPFNNHTSVRDVSLQTDSEDVMEGNRYIDEVFTLSDKKLKQTTMCNRIVEFSGDEKRFKIASRPLVKAVYDEHNYLSPPVNLGVEKSQCFYSSLLSNTSTEKNCTNIPMEYNGSEATLRKPFKKRNLHPKLCLSCGKNSQDTPLKADI